MNAREEAAAFWGSAENVAYPVKDRLAMALQALEFFGPRCEDLAAKIERLEALIRDRENAGKTWGQETEDAWTSIEIRDIRSALEDT